MLTTKVVPTLTLVRRFYQFALSLLLIMLAFLPIAALAKEAGSPIDRPFTFHDVALMTQPLTVSARTVGDPLPRIQCPPGYVATIYAEGLTAPDGLAFNPEGSLHVAEETAGRVSRIEPNGSATAIISGLASPEGIAFDNEGNLYVVEDVQNGRLIKRSPAGITTTLATNRIAPEGVVWAENGTVYLTESNAEFASAMNLPRTYLTAVPPAGVATRIITHNPSIWSYAGLTTGGDGLLYTTNEGSGNVLPPPFNTTITDSIFTVNPTTGVRSLFASDLISPEGLRFSAGGNFPLYVAEEDISGNGSNGGGRLSRVEADGSHIPLCTGFFSIEDVALDEAGRLYISEDTTGLIIVIELKQPDLVITKTATPSGGSSLEPGDFITYTITVQNNGNGPADGVIISDTLDVNTTLVSSNTTTGSLSGLNLVQLTGFTLNPSEAVTLTLGATVTGDISRPIKTHQSSVTSSQSTLLQFSNPVTHLLSQPASFPPDFSLTKSAIPPAGTVVTSGNRITYTIVVTNNGGPANNVRVSDLIPVGTVYVTDSIKANFGNTIFNGVRVRVNGMPVFSTGLVLTMSFEVTVTTDLTVPLIINRANVVSDQTARKNSNAVNHPVESMLNQLIYLPMLLKETQ